MINQKGKSTHKRTPIHNNSCPKCGQSVVNTEVDLNTGGILLVCSNKACHNLRSKGWF